MNINEILSFIYDHPKIKQSAKRITNGSDIHTDLISEMVLDLSHIDKRIVKGLHERGELIQYCCKTMFYKYTNPYSSFYKNFRVFESVSSDSLIVIEDEPIDIEGQYKCLVDAMSKVEKRIAQNRYPTEYKLLEAYIEHGTFRETEKQIGINFSTIQQSVGRIIKEIKKEYDSTYYK